MVPESWCFSMTSPKEVSSPDRARLGARHFAQLVQHQELHRITSSRHGDFRSEIKLEIKFETIGKSIETIGFIGLIQCDSMLIAIAIAQIP